MMFSMELDIEGVVNFFIKWSMHYQARDFSMKQRQLTLFLRTFFFKIHLFILSNPSPNDT